MAWEGAFKILVALKGLITNFSLNKLGGPVAMFQMSAQASENGLISILNLMGMLSTWEFSILSQFQPLTVEKLL